MSTRLQQAHALQALLESSDKALIPLAESAAVLQCARELLKEAEADAGLSLVGAALAGERLEGEALAEALILKSRFLLHLDRNSDAVAAASEAQLASTRVSRFDWSTRAQALGAFALARTGRTDEAVAILRALRKQLLGMPDSSELAQVASILSAVYVNRGDWQAGLAYSMEAIVSGRRSGDALYQAMGWFNHAQCMRGMARWAAAVESLATASSLYASEGWAHWQVRARHTLALVQWKRGQLLEATEISRDVLASSRQLLSPLTTDYARLLSGLIFLHRGNFDEAIKSISNPCVSSLDEYPRPSWLRAEYLADSYLERGEHAEALPRLDELLPRVIALAPRGDIVAEIQRRRAECLLHLGKIESGIEAVREAESIARECGDVYELACSLRMLALLLARSGKPVEAQGAFAKAFQIFDEIQTPYEWGKLWMSYGDWLGSAHSGHYFSMRAAHDAYRAAIEHFDGMRAEYKLGEAQKRLVELEARLKDEGDQAASDAEIRPRPRRRPVRDIELQRRVQWAYETFGLVTRHKPFLDMLDQIAALAVSEIPMLVLGESGTGKERIAHGIHTMSGRTGEYVAINCSAIQPTMLEAELFGYVRGAFTGADRDKPGLFESADRGTVFLDEIGEMSVDLQAKLLRFLENGSLRRIGATSDTRVRVRLLAATNRDQAKLASGDGFRSDLYFRLAHAVFTLPPLRERGDDAEVLIDHFLDVFGEDEGKRIRLSSASREQVLDYAWPGNVRQLRAMVHRLVAQSKDGHVIVPRELQLDDAGAPRNFLEEMEEQERRRILEALEKSSGVKADAARMLRLSRTTMLAKMKRYKIPM